MLQTECGYTPDEINAMTLLDVQRLANHWRRNPPLRMLVSLCAAALGVKLPEAEPTPNKSKYMNADEFARFTNATDGGRSILGGG